MLSFANLRSQKAAIHWYNSVRVPYIIIRKEILECHQGKERNKVYNASRGKEKCLQVLEYLCTVINNMTMLIAVGDGGGGAGGAVAIHSVQNVENSGK